MRKLIFQMLVSLDGYFEGPNQELDWHMTDKEFDDYTIEITRSFDGILFGRVTYEMMASFWPSEAAMRDDPIVAKNMNSLPKYVFSKTLKKVDWNNSTLVKGDPIEAVKKLKEQPGRDLAIFGSSDLAVTLIPSGLIDEYRIFINPIVLGAGKPLFKGIHKRLNLKLMSSRVFHSGLVLLNYQQAE
jgi:dihydrofolate reductase